MLREISIYCNLFCHNKLILVHAFNISCSCTLSPKIQTAKPVDTYNGDKNSAGIDNGFTSNNVEGESHNVSRPDCIEETSEAKEVTAKQHCKRMDGAEKGDQTSNDIDETNVAEQDTAKHSKRTDGAEKGDQTISNDPDETVAEHDTTKRCKRKNGAEKGDQNNDPENSTKDHSKHKDTSTEEAAQKGDATKDVGAKNDCGRDFDRNSNEDAADTIGVSTC